MHLILQSYIFHYKVSGMFRPSIIVVLVPARTDQHRGGGLQGIGQVDVVTKQDPRDRHRAEEKHTSIVGYSKR